MSTDQEVANTYQQSVDTLGLILMSPVATDEEKATAQAEIDKLNQVWDQTIQQDFAGRTAQLNFLVERLVSITGGVVTDPLQPIRDRMKEIISEAKSTLSAAAGEAFASLPALESISESEADDAAIEGVRALEHADATADNLDPADPAPSPRPVSVPTETAIAIQADKSPVAAALYKEYAGLFETCLIRPDREDLVRLATERLLGNKGRYQTLAGQTKVPWYVIALIHNLECASDFERHLHNGDPLGERTVRVPKGRPQSGQPPFSWEDSAKDALAFDGFADWSDWTVPAILYKLERYNGWGYRKHHPETLSPYLWSFTNHYTKGKYIADGKFSADAVSKQVGAAAILRVMANDGTLND